MCIRDRDQVNQWQVRADRAVRQLGHWPSSDSLASTTASNSGGAGGSRLEAEEQAAAARRAAEEQQRAAEEARRVHEYQVFFRRHVDLQARLQLLREEAAVHIRSGVPRFVADVATLQARAEPAVAARVQASSKSSLSLVISDPKKRRDKSVAAPSNSDAEDEVVCTTPLQTSLSTLCLGETANGSFVDTSPTLPASSPLAIEAASRVSAKQAGSAASSSKRKTK